MLCFSGCEQSAPELDEEYILEPKTASEMLYRRVPPEEISDRSKEWSFWSVIRRRRFETMEEARAEEKEIEEGGALDDEVSEEEEEEEGEETAKPNVVVQTSRAAYTDCGAQLE